MEDYRTPSPGDGLRGPHQTGRLCWWVLSSCSHLVDKGEVSHILTGKAAGRGVVTARGVGARVDGQLWSQSVSSES